MSSSQQKKKAHKQGAVFSTKTVSFKGRNLPALALPEDGKMLIEPEGIQKMSQIILDFARPLLVGIDLDDEVEIERVVHLACIAWNMALVLEETPGTTLQDILKDLTAPEDDALDFFEETKQDLEMLVRRKQRHFAQHKRFIQNYYTGFDKNGPRLQILSTWPDAE